MKQIYPSDRNSNYYMLLIVVAMVFSPFTSIRVGPIGVTEVSMILFVLITVLNRSLKYNGGRVNRFIFTKFWIVFLFFSLMGVGYNYLLKNHFSGTLDTMIFDTLAYFLVSLFCFTLEVVIYNKQIDIWKLITKTYWYMSSVLLLLYIVSGFTSNLFGYSLTYYHFFRPFANNIHQVSMVIAPLPFIGIKLLLSEKKIITKVYLLILIISNLITGNATGSTKVMMGFLFGLIVFICYAGFNRTSNRKQKVLIVLTILVIMFTFFIVNYSDLVRYADDFFTTKDKGAAREGLYKSSVLKIINSPFVGYGPGSHSERISGWYSDAHQSFLTIGIQAGLVALISYIILHIKIFKVCSNNAYVLGSYIGILMYALGGDIIRKAPMWIFLILLYYYCLGNYPPKGHNK